MPSVDAWDGSDALNPLVVKCMPSVDAWDGSDALKLLVVRKAIVSMRFGGRI